MADIIDFESKKKTSVSFNQNLGYSVTVNGMPYEETLQPSWVMTNSKEKEYERFIRSLLNPEMFGYAVSAEVRDEARYVLGMKKVETTK